MYIFIDGIDGTGKTTLVKKLKGCGYQHVYDRSILTKMSITPLNELPDNIPILENIIEQLDKIKTTYSSDDLSTNRDIMTKLDFNLCQNVKNAGSAKNRDTCVYIILDATVDTALKRLHERYLETKIELNGWDSEKSVRYFRSKYLFLANKYRLPIIDTESKTEDQVLRDVLNIINNERIQGNNTCLLSEINNFDPIILELEWLCLGESDIIYADSNICLSRCSDREFNIEKYQKRVLEKISHNCLSNFINQIKKIN